MIRGANRFSFSSGSRFVHFFTAPPTTPTDGLPYLPGRVYALARLLNSLPAPVYGRLVVNHVLASRDAGIQSGGLGHRLDVHLLLEAFHTLLVGP